jgi:hypothetical protein
MIKKIDSIKILPHASFKNTKQLAGRAVLTGRQSILRVSCRCPAECSWPIPPHSVRRAAFPPRNRSGKEKCTKIEINSEFKFRIYGNSTRLSTGQTSSKRQNPSKKINVLDDEVNFFPYTLCWELGGHYFQKRTVKFFDS